MANVNKRVLSIFLLMLLLGGGFFYFSLQNKDQTLEPQEKSQSASTQGDSTELDDKQEDQDEKLLSVISVSGSGNDSTPERKVKAINVNEEKGLVQKQEESEVRLLEGQTIEKPQNWKQDELEKRNIASLEDVPENVNVKKTSQMKSRAQAVQSQNLERQDSRDEGFVDSSLLVEPQVQSEEESVTKQVQPERLVASEEKILLEAEHNREKEAEEVLDEDDDDSVDQGEFEIAAYYSEKKEEQPVKVIDVEKASKDERDFKLSRYLANSEAPLQTRPGYFFSDKFWETVWAGVGYGVGSQEIDQSIQLGNSRKFESDSNSNFHFEFGFSLSKSKNWWFETEVQMTQEKPVFSEDTGLYKGEEMYLNITSLFAPQLGNWSVPFGLNYQSFPLALEGPGVGEYSQLTAQYGALILGVNYEKMFWDYLTLDAKLLMSYILIQGQQDISFVGSKSLILNSSFELTAPIYGDWSLGGRIDYGLPFINYRLEERGFTFRGDLQFMKQNFWLLLRYNY